MFQFSSFNVQTKKGFTFPEVLITLGILGVLFGMVTVNLFGTKHSTTLDSSKTSLVTDLNQQRLKAMIGDTEGTGEITAYGIYFEQTEYILFRGATYNPSDPSNFSINAGESIEFTNNLLPLQQIVFLPVSGEVSGFLQGANTISIRNTVSEEENIIVINRFGTVEGIN